MLRPTESRDIDADAKTTESTQYTVVSDQSANPLSTTESTTESPSEPPPEFGGQKGPEPTRYGDWEKNGRCTDF